MLEQYIPLFIALAVALIFGAVLVWSSTLIGPQRPNREKTSTYESGMKPVGTVRERISDKILSCCYVLYNFRSGSDFYLPVGCGIQKIIW